MEGCGCCTGHRGVLPSREAERSRQVAQRFGFAKVEGDGPRAAEVGLGREILSPIHRRSVGKPDRLVWHVGNFLGRLIGQHQLAFKHGRSASTCDGCIDGERSGVVD